MVLWEVRVRSREGDEPLARQLVSQLGLYGVSAVALARVYRLEGDLTVNQVTFLAERLFCEDITHRYTVDQPILEEGRVVEVAYKPGVMNPEVGSVLKATEDLGIVLLAADSSTEYAFQGEIAEDDFVKVVAGLMNPAVQRVVSERPTTLVVQGQRGKVQIVPIRELDDDQLMALSKDTLFLNLEEMQIIQRYFQGLGRDPTDAELETLAQTGSEHCQHKTFKAQIVLGDEVKTPFIERIMGVSRKYDRHVVSAFGDNSGVIDFYDGWGICGKVETHNSPSAVEPYGGAATGTGGVLRDIMGTGQGAYVLASTDMFCFAPPDLPLTEVPPGCLHPRYLLERVVAGVRDYGNRFGVPTNNGSVRFHPDFRAKPTIIVGAYGMMRNEHALKGEPEPGDLVVAVGGRTGRDGIHGATFSSAEMTDRTATVNGTAVQIGHAIEEKRMADALLACRDAGLIRAITDCGAGGFSSAIGEMGSKTGVRVQLELAPLKYVGLAPWEVWLSESQERMVAAVAPEHLDQFLAICRDHNVEATWLGEFTDDHLLRVTYDREMVVDLDMEFVHHGLPQRVMKASWQSPFRPEPNEFDLPELTSSVAWQELYERVMSHGDICSKEPIVRQYDHGVQGTNMLAPFTGVSETGPNDAVVLRPLLDRPYGLVIAHGMNPRLNTIDPYWGAIWAAAEAAANLVATGGDLTTCGLIDNFIWPFPTEAQLGALDRAVDGCVVIADGLQLPFVSGKDSLSSTYRKEESVIEIPPVLCISIFGSIPNVGLTVSSDFKRPGSKIVLVRPRKQRLQLGGSVYYDLHGFVGHRLPQIDLAEFRTYALALQEQVREGHVLACHDISEGGLGVALAEMCFGGGCGAVIDLQSLGEGRSDQRFFAETAGCFLVEVAEENLESFFQGLAGYATIIGQSVAEQVIVLLDGTSDYTISVPQLEAAWQKPMREVFA